jgi:hypothetical protein
MADQNEVEVSALEKIAEGAEQLAGTLGAITPVALIGIGLVKMFVSELRQRGIQTGPFADRIAGAEAKADAILANDALFRKMHGA